MPLRRHLGRTCLAKPTLFTRDQVFDLLLAFRHLVNFDIVFGDIAGKLGALHLKRQEIGGNCSTCVDISADQRLHDLVATKLAFCRIQLGLRRIALLALRLQAR
jgi:hypothetical protein